MSLVLVLVFIFRKTSGSTMGQYGDTRPRLTRVAWRVSTSLDSENGEILNACSIHKHPMLHKTPRQNVDHLAQAFAWRLGKQPRKGAQRAKPNNDHDPHQATPPGGLRSELRLRRSREDLQRAPALSEPPPAQTDGPFLSANFADYASMHETGE